MAGGEEGETGRRSSDVRGLARRLLRPHAFALAIALVLMLLQSTATLAQPWLGGVLTDRLLVQVTRGRVQGNGRR